MLRLLAVLVRLRGEHEPFVFPEKKELTLRLRNMIDVVVDERYYLKESTIRIILASEAVQEFSAKPLINKTKSSIIRLPVQEYAEFCSAIRTKHADKIPAKGTILYGNHYYKFTYSKTKEQILCRFKVPILGNEDKINYREGNDAK